MICASTLQENRKRETRQLVSQVVRREEEMTENHLGDNESEGDAPDDDDDLDEVRHRSSLQSWFVFMSRKRHTSAAYIASTDGCFRSNV